MTGGRHHVRGVSSLTVVCVRQAPVSPHEVCSMFLLCIVGWAEMEFGGVNDLGPVRLAGKTADADADLL